MILTKNINLTTQGNDDIIDITEEVRENINKSKIGNGVVSIFAPGATGALTTIEYESGLICDLKDILEKIIPKNKNYQHNMKWHDGNGHSHLKASLVGPSIIVPFHDKKLLLGTWQQIIFIDFDVRPRQRKLILQIIG